MFSTAEILFNLLWLGMIGLAGIITYIILKNRDPYDDGPLLDEESD